MTAIESPVYVGDVGTIILADTTADLTSATALKLSVRKPDAAEDVEWTGTESETTKVRYVVQEGDLDVAGDYLIQPLVTLPSGTWRGQTTKLVVKERFT